MAAIAFAAWIAQDTSGPPGDVEITVTEGTSMSAAVSPDHLWIAIDLLGSLWLALSIAVYGWGKTRFFVRQPLAPEKPGPTTAAPRTAS